MNKWRISLSIFNLTYITLMLFANLVLILLKVDWNIILYVNIPDIFVYIINLNFMLLKFGQIKKQTKQTKLTQPEVEQLLENWNQQLEFNKKD
ncbi:hypothetical protein [Spiroplasma culicicola]|uniref:Uncharacterized protein n=1 Tax=Spiroplasma culicicola AES-1 TaxID=1276246 RepID=W6A764_9MOLU|nr:hypothetical protein [Spiroplasma culicicola]AHI52983.1 hypothetical protein SCULI_v1c06420 [Spiroplasma culicicola AES-1]